ncbi:MAG TPA: hypothetical protein VGQ83_14950 [Polyangia bacterium]
MRRAFVIIGLLAWVSAVQAEPVVAKIRLHLPVTELTTFHWSEFRMSGNGSSDTLLGLGGLSAVLEWAGPVRLALELGGNANVTVGAGRGFDAFLRGGWVPTLGHTQRGGSRGCAAQAAALLGMRWFNLAQFDTDRSVQVDMATVTGSVGFEVTCWQRPQASPTVRILAGVGIPVHQSTDYYPRPSWSLDMGIDVGLAF